MLFMKHFAIIHIDDLNFDLTQIGTRMVNNANIHDHE